MKLWLLVALFLVGCGRSPDVKKTVTATAKAKSIAKVNAKHNDPAPQASEPAPKATEETAVDDPFGVGDAPERKSIVTPEEYRAAEARQISAKREAERFAEEKKLAVFTLTAKELEIVEHINDTLDNKGLWGVKRANIAFAMSDAANPLCREALGKAAERRGNSALEIKLDMLNMDSFDRILFAGTYDLVEREQIAAMLVQLHDGTWSGDNDNLARYREKLFFKEAITAYLKKTR